MLRSDLSPSGNASFLLKVTVALPSEQSSSGMSGKLKLLFITAELSFQHLIEFMQPTIGLNGLDPQCSRV